MNNLTFNNTGSGIALVFLHGFCESKEVWQSCHQHLSSHYNVISVDLPGFGKSEAIANVSIESMADAVHTTIANLGLKHYILIGHSMGGYVALALAEKYTDVLQGLCLFNSTAYADNEEKKTQRNKTITYLEDNGVASFIKPFVPPLFAPQNRVKCDLAIQKLIEIGLNISLEVIKDSAAAMRDRSDRTLVLKKAQYPVLFIAGDLDATIKLESIEALSKLPSKSKLVVLKNTAHQGIFEDEAASIDALKQFAENIIQQK